jgi:hypothetical protein
MSRERLIKLKEHILSKPFTPKLSEIVDRIDYFLEKGEGCESDAHSK